MKGKNLSMFLSVVMMIFLVFGTALAKQPPPPPPTPVCGGLTGTWHGEQPGDMVWLAIHTSDSLDPAKGEMLMNWIDTKFLGPGVLLTPGHGVWKFNGDGTYNYTWYAFATTSDGMMKGTLRVSGVALFDQVNPVNPEDCNTIYIYYKLDYFEGFVPVGGWDLADPSGSEDGVAYQTRLPLVVTPLPSTE